MEQPPALLHKYRDLRGDGLAWLRASLIQKHVWFSRPVDFNDPFDCAPNVRTTWDQKSAQQIARRVVQRDSRGASRTDKRRLKSRLRRMPPKIDRETLWDAQFQAQTVMNRVREQIGVLSLSATDRDVLMWSHYAGSHTGVVLSFLTSDPMFRRAMPVYYCAERPVVDLIADRSNVMEKALLHKADYWEYEHEWRCLLPGQFGTVSFAPESLAKITFGAKTSSEHKDAVRQAVAIGNLNPQFAQATLDESFFRLNIDRL